MAERIEKKDCNKLNGCHPRGRQPLLFCAIQVLLFLFHPDEFRGVVAAALGFGEDGVEGLPGLAKADRLVSQSFLSS